jgi:hypothetical protein
MTSLESKLYVALMGARTIVSATAYVNPQAIKILRLVDAAAADYKRQADAQRPAEDDEEQESEQEDERATGN